MDQNFYAGEASIFCSSQCGKGEDVPELLSLAGFFLMPGINI
jgi:hypothetical protein